MTIPVPTKPATEPPILTPAALISMFVIASAATNNILKRQYKRHERILCTTKR